ncbi:MAG: DUF4957 domain-containing protein [Hymenobacteraceae bacterium]|nr:DUF4957 domain-containing protein [Hymenobacteraceae bacterium]
MKDYLKKISGTLVPVLLLGLVTVACKKEVDSLEPMRMFTPAGLIKSVSGETQVKLTWNPSLYTTASSGVTYTVEVAADTLFATPVLLTVQTDTAGVVFTDEQLEEKKDYYARIRANALGDRPESKTVVSNRFRIRGEQILSPVLTSDIKDKSVMLRWRNTAGLTKIVATPQAGSAIEYVVTAEDIEAQQKRLTGLAPTTLYVVEIFAGARSKGTVSFTTKEESIFTTTVAPTDDLLAVIESAANGDVIGLEQGVHDYSGSTFVIAQKQLTLQSVSGNPENTKVLFKEVNLKGTGAGVKLSGIEFDGGPGNAAYFLNLAGMGSDSEAAVFTSILVENCIVKNTANCFMRANRGGNNAHKIESIVITNTIGFNNGISTYNYIMLDKMEFKKLEIKNSTFFNIARAFISWSTNLTVPTRPVITIDQTTINSFGFADRNNILMDANANPISFTMQNSIVANTPREGNVGTSLLRAAAEGSDVIVRNSNLFKLTTGATPAVALTFPSYVQQFNNLAVDLGWTNATTTFTLPAESPLRTAGNTGGPIGDLRWTR